VSAAGGEAAPGRVLSAGVYLNDHESAVGKIVAELRTSSNWSVEHRWIAVGAGDVPAEVAPDTAFVVHAPRPKFQLLNEILGPIVLAPYDYLLVCDDDVRLPAEFLDRYLEQVVRHDLALAQPARTHDSPSLNSFVEQMDGVDARLTRFVEAGPLFSIRRDVFGLLLPFDDGSPFGWGYDLMWPVAIQAAGLRMGIVDATPIAQPARRAAGLHAPPDPRAVKTFLDRHPHISRAEAFTLLEAYA
jgi:hypothetical protein